MSGIDVKLLNKFMLSLVSPESEKSVNMLFQNYYDSPIGSFQNGMHAFQHFLHSESLETSSAVAQGFICGIICAKLIEDPTLKVKLFDSWVEQHAREKGENVVSFSSRKVDRDE